MNNKLCYNVSYSKKCIVSIRQIEIKTKLIQMYDLNWKILFNVYTISICWYQNNSLPGKICPAGVAICSSEGCRKMF